MSMILDIWKKRITRINDEYRKLVEAIHIQENELLKLEMALVEKKQELHNMEYKLELLENEILNSLPR